MSSAKSELELVLTKRKKSRRRRNRIWDGDLECGEGGNHVEVKDSFLISEIDKKSLIFFHGGETLPFAEAETVSL